ncbi:winged helix-turn-helix domain-containing protein [Aliikangiella sp. IMCC44359]|uniref:winged helix-turn-helix domain-containing protein n=1 Tax=Aliikangiella sp. IMCC44359 TaxID=3459125 RepID=UPI00403AC5C3
MQWKINKLVFCERKQYLISENKRIQLEPRQAEVLAYFCRHVNQLVSRNDLVEHIWQGQVITDNAINRVIAKLRKSLGDNAKESEYIVTIPRKGYRMIALVSLGLEAENHVSGVRASNSNKPTELVNNNEVKSATPTVLNYRLFSVVFLLIALVMFFYAMTNSTQPMQFKSLETLTRDKGEEFLPAVSPDGHFLIYSTNESERLDLYLKNLSTNETRLISDRLGNAGGGAWSKSGSKFIYLYTSRNTCEFRMFEFTHDQSMGIKQHSTVHHCPVGSYGNVVFSHDEKSIIFSESQKPQSSYYIYIKNLDDGEVEKLKQPPVFLAGNREFDLHPKQNKLLIASPDLQQQLAFYQLDIEQNRLSFLFKKDEYLCCPLWDHQGNNIIMTGPLPRTSIVELDLNGEQVRTLYTSSHKIYKLRRLAKSNQFVYSGGFYNTDIEYTDFLSSEKITLVDSMAADSVPTVSSHNQLAYISKRNGKGQVWIMNLKSNKETMLTHFVDNHKYFDLQWSPENKQIAGLMINGIKLVDVKSGNYRILNIPQQEIRGMSWRDEQTLAFSLKYHNQWRAHHYAINSNTMTMLDKDWAYVYYYGENFLGISQNNEFYYNLLPIDLRVTTPVDHQRRFYFQLFNESIYYQKSIDDKNALVRYDLTQNKEKKLIFIRRFSEFSVSSQGVYSTTYQSKDADIFRISFQN